LQAVRVVSAVVAVACGCGRIGFDAGERPDDAPTALTVASVFPTAVTAAAGQALELHGTGFEAIEAVLVGGTSCVERARSSTVFECSLAGGLPVAAHDIEIQTRSGSLVSSSPVVVVGDPVLWLRPEAIAVADGAAITRWADASGFGHDALAAGARAPRFAVGELALGGASFGSSDTTPDFLTITDTPNLRPATVSIAILYRQTALTGWDKIVAKDYHNDGTWAAPWVSYNFSASYASTGQPYFETTQAGTEHKLISSIVVPDMAPHVGIGTYDGTELVLDVDGVELNREPQTGPIAYPVSSDLTIGSRSPYTAGEHFTGTVGEVLVWGRGLTPSERATLNAYLGGRR